MKMSILSHLIMTISLGLVTSRRRMWLWSRTVQWKHVMKKLSKLMALPVSYVAKYLAIGRPLAMIFVRFVMIWRIMVWLIIKFDFRLIRNKVSWDMECYIMLDPKILHAEMDVCRTTNDSTLTNTQNLSQCALQWKYWGDRIAWEIRKSWPSIPNSAVQSGPFV
jgi:hypothetical protein